MTFCLKLHSFLAKLRFIHRFVAQRLTHYYFYIENRNRRKTRNPDPKYSITYINAFNPAELDDLALLLTGLGVAASGPGLLNRHIHNLKNWRYWCNFQIEIVVGLSMLKALS